MSWSRVVWKKLLREEEMTIPTIWVVNKNVCWPKSNNVIRACSQQWPPKDDWIKYPIIKIKIQSDDKSLCDGFDFTSEEENEDLHNTKNQKHSIAVKRKSSITQSPFQQPFKSPNLIIN
nr:uncharacterized protein LOC124818440 [Hydra vulgaris]